MLARDRELVGLAPGDQLTPGDLGRVLLPGVAAYTWLGMLSFAALFGHLLS
jgi:hypothetical protein